MKIAIIGSRNITIKNIDKYISIDDEIVSGGAKGIDTCAAEYARINGIKLTEFLPQYEIYGRAAPIVRNKAIVDYADKVIAEESRTHTPCGEQFLRLSPNLVLQDRHLASTRFD